MTGVMEGGCALAKGRHDVWNLEMLTFSRNRNPFSRVSFSCHRIPIITFSRGLLKFAWVRLLARLIFGTHILM